MPQRSEEHQNGPHCALGSPERLAHRLQLRTVRTKEYSKNDMQRKLMHGRLHDEAIARLQSGGKSLGNIRHGRTVLDERRAAEERHKRLSASDLLSSAGLHQRRGAKIGFRLFHESLEGFGLRGVNRTDSLGPSGHHQLAKRRGQCEWIAEPLDAPGIVAAGIPEHIDHCNVLRARSRR